MWRHMLGNGEDTTINMFKKGYYLVFPALTICATALPKYNPSPYTASLPPYSVIVSYFLLHSSSSGIPFAYFYPFSFSLSSQFNMT